MQSGSERKHAFVTNVKNIQGIEVITIESVSKLYFTDVGKALTLYT